MKVTKEDRLERIEKLIEQLQGCSDRETIARLGQREHDWLFENYPASSAGTFISGEYIPAIVRAFPAKEGDELGWNEIWQKVNGELIKRHLVVETLKPTKEEWVERNQPVIESTVTRVNGKLPLNPLPLIKKAESMLSSDSWATVAAALILLTGRRPSEIAWCGEFSPMSLSSLIFKGQLKKGEVETEPFEIPTLIDAERVFRAYNRLRYLQQTKTKILSIPSAKEAARKTNNQINQAIRKHFSDLLTAPSDRKGKTKQLSAGNLRAAYGKIAAHFYCPEECEPILFVSKILGHQGENYSTESLATTIHYCTYRIIDDENFSLPNVASTDCDLTSEKVTDLTRSCHEEVTNSTVHDRNQDEVTDSQVKDRNVEQVSDPTVNDRNQDEVTDSTVGDRNVDEVSSSTAGDRNQDEVTDPTAGDRNQDEVTDSTVRDRNVDEVSSSTFCDGAWVKVTDSTVGDQPNKKVTDSQGNDRALEKVTDSLLAIEP